MAPDLWLFCVLAAAFGLLFGSFLNVCIYRIPRDLSVVLPRSFCPECGAPIAWYDNIPLLSYAVLRGRCRQCSQPISFRYPVVEGITALLFLLTVAQYGWSLVALKWVVFEAMLVLLFWTDIEERILPDEITLGGSLLGLLLAIFFPVPGALAGLLLPAAGPMLQSLFNAAAGAIVLAGGLGLVGAAYQRFRGRIGLGAGDVKLMILIGVFLGLEQGVVALLIGSVSGSLIGVTYIVAARKNPSEYWLPFGSFLCAGAAIAALVRVSF